METITSLFKRAVETSPERIFLRQISGLAERLTTYAQAGLRMASIADQLQRLGVEKGDRVVIYLEEMTPSIYWLLSCAQLGAVPVPLGPTSSAAMVVRLAERVSAKQIVTTVKHAPVLLERGLVPVCLREPGSTDGVHLVDLDPTTDRVAQAENDAIHPEDLYLIQPTSGTTGEPKLVMRNHLTFVRAGGILTATLPKDKPQRVLMVAALTHGMGQYQLAAAISIAAEMCVPSEIDTKASLDEVRRLDPTVLTMTPRVLRSLYKQYADKNEADRFLGPSAAMLLTSGAATDENILHFVTSQGIDVADCYGASEISILSITERGQWREGLVGTILPDVEVKTAPDGELLAKCPGRMMGYWGDPTTTHQAFTADGFYRTGDYLEVTADGELKYLGRKRDVFNTMDGSNVHPTRLESLIEALPWVRQVILLGDQRPFIVALLSVEASSVMNSDGYLEPREHSALYKQARNDLASLNRTLEPSEQIRRFALFARPFGKELYDVVGHGKVRRDRSATLKIFHERIDLLYTSSSATAMSCEG
jgi:long-chain acyl-CoA synthetase